MSDIELDVDEPEIIDDHVDDEDGEDDIAIVGANDEEDEEDEDNEGTDLDEEDEDNEGTDLDEGDEEDEDENENQDGMMGGAVGGDFVDELTAGGGEALAVSELDEDILGDRNKKIVHHDNILHLHPGSQYRNYDEIYASSIVTRNENNIIVDALHRAIPIMTKYEKARILGMRTKQLNKSKKIKPYVQVDRMTMDNSIIAEMELEQKKLPFIIERPIPGGGVEYWNVKDLELI